MIGLYSFAMAFAFSTGKLVMLPEVFTLLFVSLAGTSVPLPIRSRNVPFVHACLTAAFLAWEFGWNLSHLPSCWPLSKWSPPNGSPV